MNYQDKSYSDITNANAIPSFVIVNALVGYQAHGWGVNFNLHNLAGRRYFVAANGAGAFVGEPRNAMMSVHADL